MRKLFIFLVIIAAAIGCNQTENKKKRQSVKPVQNPNDVIPQKGAPKVAQPNPNPKNNPPKKRAQEVKPSEKKTPIQTEQQPIQVQNRIPAERKSILKKALSYENKKVDGIRYNSDLLKDLYSEYGVDPTRIDPKEKVDQEGKWLGNIAIVYKYFQKHGVIYKDRLPKVGDIVFFDNTYDKNRDKLYNDTLTNLGIVVDVEKDGTVHFLSNSSRKGVVRYMLNRTSPKQRSIKNRNLTKTINTQLRFQSKEERKEGKETPQFAGELFNSYGTLLDVPNRNTLIELRPNRVISKEKRKEFVQALLKLEGKKIDGVRYGSDLVKYMTHRYKVDPTDIPQEDKRDQEGKWLGTTEIIHKYVRKYGSIYRSHLPKAGDIVFFDNTFDKNKDKEYNDLLTNVGIVVEIEKDGTVHFLTNSRKKGVVRYMLHSKFPKQRSIKHRNVTKTINTQMRWQSKEDQKAGKETPQLAGELLNSYGSLFQ